MKPFLRILYGSLLIFTVLTLSACTKEKKNDSLAKIKNLEFTVISEDCIPEELHQVIMQKKGTPFKITYIDNGFLYICIGYGEQSGGGFSISVNELYLTENAIYFDTTLIGPEPGSASSGQDISSYPYLVVKTEFIDEPVVYQ